MTTAATGSKTTVINIGGAAEAYGIVTNTAGFLSTHVIGMFTHGLDAIMAFFTIPRQGVKHATDMAVLTIDHIVLPGQRKPR